jgi:hypothetical protein
MAAAGHFLGVFLLWGERVTGRIELPYGRVKAAQGGLKQSKKPGVAAGLWHVVLGKEAAD